MGDKVEGSHLFSIQIVTWSLIIESRLSLASLAPPLSLSLSHKLFPTASLSLCLSLAFSNNSVD